MTTEPKTVRELARDLVDAQQTYRAVYESISHAMPAEDRIDAEIALSAARIKLGNASMALDAAQRRAA